MLDMLNKSCTVFDGHRRIASGYLGDLVLKVKEAVASNPTGPVLVYDDGTGRVIDIDTRGEAEEITARLSRLAADRPSAEMPQAATEPRGRGRPKLGVVAREVTLLPRHWEWLGTQPGGASVALRKLVEEARRAGREHDQSRTAKEAAYCFMSAMAGDFPGFEEAARALFAGDQDRFCDLVGPWPQDVRDYAVRLAFAGGETSQIHNETRGPMK